MVPVSCPQEMREFEKKGQIPDDFLDQASVGSMTELFNVLDTWLQVDFALMKDEVVVHRRPAGRV